MVAIAVGIGANRQITRNKYNLDINVKNYGNNFLCDLLGALDEFIGGHRGQFAPLFPV